jgi:hypothetical protein
MATYSGEVSEELPTGLELVGSLLAPSGAEEFAVTAARIKTRIGAT